jgi:hypothetical protein
LVMHLCFKPKLSLFSPNCQTLIHKQAKEIYLSQ